MDFTITRAHLTEGIVELTVAGEVDLLAAPFLKEELADAIDSGARHVIVNLSAATFVDSTTLGALMGASGRIRKDGGALVIVCSNPQIRTIFEITRLDKAFGIFEDTDEAVAHLADQFRGPTSSFDPTSSSSA